jgi:hypothetical protein
MWRRVRWTLIAITVVLSTAAAAEPFSLRCADPKVSRPFFVTFDLETGRVVFESTIGSRHSGEIRKIEGERIAFSIGADHGRIDLVLDRGGGDRMVWAGISADPIRPVLVQPCVAIDLRTLLSVFDDQRASAPAIQPFSLACRNEYDQPYFFTMDRETGKVVMEGLMGGGFYPGEIQSSGGRRIEFLVPAGRTPGLELTWDGEKGTVTSHGIAGDSTRPTKVHRCDEIKARSIMVIYDRVR